MASKQPPAAAEAPETIEIEAPDPVPRAERPQEPPLPDDAAEAAALADDRDRAGEASLTTALTENDLEQESNRPLPALEELLKVLEPKVRASLEELYRARFTRVTRLKVRDLRK